MLYLKLFAIEHEIEKSVTSTSTYSAFCLSLFLTAYILFALKKYFLFIMIIINQGMKKLWIV